jgi:hypothetical protein
MPFEVFDIFSLHFENYANSRRNSISWLTISLGVQLLIYCLNPACQENLAAFLFSTLSEISM